MLSVRLHFTDGRYESLLDGMLSVRLHFTDGRYESLLDGSRTRETR